MARTLKGTRARGLPPKVLLSQRQDATGSFPTIWRTSSDNRTGRYPVFFNDKKVLVFNKPVTDVGISANTYPAYEEKVITVGSLGNPVTGSVITFDYPFMGTPIVALTELTPNTNTPTVNVFVTNITNTNLTIGFSGPFEGTIVYRAIFQFIQGEPVNVVRSPRFTNQYSLVVAKYGSLIDDHVDINFSDFGSIPSENYIVFRDFLVNNAQDISGSGSVSNTSIAVTGSANGLGSTLMYYMGFGTTTLTNNDIKVNGIVYPLEMTPETINSGLSPEAKADLYKQPYFSGSAIVNQPIVASGRMGKGIADTFITFTPGQDVEPFQDFANPEVDGKISANIGGVNPFYATGSAVTTTGLGFQQPLWSKNKIEIDITPAAAQTISFENTGSSGNYPMCYWNPSTKQYEGIGTGRGLWSGFGNSAPSDVSALKSLLDNQVYGFGASVDVGLNTLTQIGSNLYARQISTFGFPYHPKFQPTSSQQIIMSDYISEPFLLEKIVFEYSGSLEVNGGTGLTDSAIWTFFLLNSKNQVPNKESDIQTIRYQNFGTSTVGTFLTSSILTNSYLDLVDYFQVAFTGSFSSFDVQAINRELIVTPTLLYSPFRYRYTNQMIVSSSVKSSLKYDGFGFYATKNSLNQILAISQSLNVSGRNELYPSNGRDWRTTFESNQLSGISVSPNPGVISEVETNTTYTKINPYVLLPTDKLTFGFQLPWSSTMGYVNYQMTSSIGFAPTGVNKIILYGSSLRVNTETNQLEEYHEDSLNQLLSSESIHETIG